MLRDYSRGKIYKIVDNTTDRIYVGSTCEPAPAKRLSQHVTDYKRWKNGNYHFVSSFHIIEKGNYIIVLLESYPCKNNNELRAKEQEWGKKLKTCNKNNPYSGLTIQEYSKNTVKKIVKI